MRENTGIWAKIAPMSGQKHLDLASNVALHASKLCAYYHDMCSLEIRISAYIWRQTWRYMHHSFSRRKASLGRYTATNIDDCAIF